ncbi:Uncharacterized protein TCM_016306 [Theobroma cacao]|uniref:Uncharacterized protein n=1 Tax=Theobroma cacao TaxID=3641 RepID=A0A061G5G5_THECC|nr:Uncharacterized protein TCM_016306 [Theobroma cacao]
MKIWQGQNDMFCIICKTKLLFHEYMERLMKFTSRNIAIKPQSRLCFASIIGEHICTYLYAWSFFLSFFLPSCLCEHQENAKSTYTNLSTNAPIAMRSCSGCKAGVAKISVERCRL